jgi:hypothetical protein
MGSLGVSNRVVALKFLTKLSEVESELKNARTVIQNLRDQVTALSSARYVIRTQCSKPKHN